MTYESIIFDIDGTLWDSRALVAEGYNTQLRAEGLGHLSVTAEDLKPLFGKTTDAIADILFTSIPAPERYALMRRCMDRETEILHADPCHIGYDGVLETIRTLAEKHRIFIVSNSERGYPELCMEKLGLTPCISGHLCHGDTGESKGKTIRALMARHNITDCVYIGDTQGDLEACREAGVPFIFAAYGLGSADSWDGKIDSITQLLHL